MFSIKTLMCGSLLLFLIFLRTGNFHLIRSNEVYQTLIQDLSDQYGCQSVILFYACESPNDIEWFTRVKKLHEELSRNMVSTTLSNVDGFIKMNGQKLHNLGNQLLVFLDSAESLMHQLMTKLAPLTDISQSVWLIFVEDNMSLEQFFTDFYLPYNSQFILSKRNRQLDGDYEKIIEIYKVSKESKLLQNVIGCWRQGYGMIEFTSMGLSRRRMDMGGQQLRVAVDSARMKLLETSDKIHPVDLKEFSILIFNTLQRGLNFTPIFQETAAGRRNDIWAENIVQLVNNISDIEIIMTSMESELVGVIEWTSPLFAIRNFFHFRQQKELIYWNAFIDPFDKWIWIVLGCLIVFSATFIKFVTLLDPKNHSLIKINGIPSNSSNPYLDAFGAMCGQAMPASKITSVRIIQYTIHLTAVVIYAAYSAVLTSSLTTNGPEVIPLTLEEIIDDDHFEVGMLWNARNQLFFKTSQDESIRRLTERKRLSEITMPSTTVQGVEKACNENGYAFLTSHLIVEHSKPQNCRLLSTEQINYQVYGYGIQRHNPYRTIIDFYLLLLRENGVLRKSLDDVLKQLKKARSNEVEYVSVDFDDIIPILLCLGAAYVLSVLILLFELLIHARKARIRFRRCYQNFQQRIILNVSKNHKRSRFSSKKKNDF